MSVVWSVEIPFDQSSVRASVPQKPGVYELRQSQPYARYAGTTNVIKIGKSDSDLRAEILNHLVRHTVANRLVRIRSSPGLVVTVAFAELLALDAGLEEAKLLREFEDRHFDLPVLNSQRGYARAADRHHREHAV